MVLDMIVTIDPFVCVKSTNKMNYVKLKKWTFYNNEITIISASYYIKLIIWYIRIWSWRLKKCFNNKWLCLNHMWNIFGPPGRPSAGVRIYYATNRFMAAI